MPETTSPAAALSTLADDYWKAFLERHPVWATALAVHDHDDRIDDASLEALSAWRSALDGFLSRLQALEASRLTGRDAVTRQVLETELSLQRRMADLGMERWSVDQLAGPQVSLFDLVRVHPVTDPVSAQTFLARVEAMPEQVRQHEKNLREGLRRGESAASCTVVRVLEQLDHLLEEGPGASSLGQVGVERPKAFPGEEWDAFTKALPVSLERGLFQALDEYRTFLRDTVLPKARSQPGLVSLPGGPAIYRALILSHVSLDVPPEELHQTGLSEMARLRTQMEELAAELFPGMTLSEAFRALRENPEYSFATREEIVVRAEAAVARATEAATRCFSLLPSQPCVVRPIDPHAERAAPAAFYMGPAPDGTRPGTYFVNTYEPTSRPRHDAEVVAFHEAVPGHHLQVALAQELSDLPEFMRHSHCTAYVEGWALYTERLADELGLYTGPLDRLGMLSCDAWRASRLVVDTGLHALGWSRDRAIQYLAENTAASMTDIRNEVDRYVAWPGQALSYKVGQLEILDLRRRAEQARGDRFDLKDFHRVVLGSGGVPLPVLRRQVEAWMASA